MEDLAQQAIRAALSGDWKIAEKINQQILISNPNDIDSLNRLARAQIELGKIRDAQKTYQRVLKLDKYNSIATRGIEKLKNRKPEKNGKNKITQSLQNRFLEEPGKTKTVQLINPGSDKALAALDTGEEIQIVTGAHRVSLFSESGKYIGRLPDDLSARLLKLIKGGNKYQALVKSVESGHVKIFLREIFRAEKFANIPSFTQTEKTEYLAFTPPELVHEEPPQVSTFEEEDENQS